MSRFASAPWPLKAAYAGVLAAAALGILAVLALGIALAGLKRLSSHLDAAAVPAWFWYFRHDPQVLRRLPRRPRSGGRPVRSARRGGPDRPLQSARPHPPRRPHRGAGRAAEAGGDAVPGAAGRRPVLGGGRTDGLHRGRRLHRRDT